LKILLLEDDEAILTGLKYSIENEGYEVLTAQTVKEAISQIGQNQINLYILDISLPDGSGYEVCKKVKEKGNMPVIFLTASDDEISTVMGLELGGDDYISKPFRLGELMARIKSVMRRYDGEQSDVRIRLRDLSILPKQAKVYKNDKEIELSAMEYRLLLILFNNRGIVLTRNKILENLWDVNGDFINDNTLTVYIKRLRDKIEENPANPKYIETIRGLGYIMD